MGAKPNTPQPSTPSDSAEPDFAQMERMLKAQLDQADKNPRDVLWQLARLYQATKRPDQALQCLRRILASESDLEVKVPEGWAFLTRSCRPSSMGGWIIARALRIARRHRVRVRRAYLFGAAAPRTSRWPELLEAVSDRLWNFYSDEDDVLHRFCADSIGLYGLPCYHAKARDVNCSSLIESHWDWADNVQECLTRARLSDRRL